MPGRNDKCPWTKDGKHTNGCGCGGGAPSRREETRRGKQARAYEAAKNADVDKFNAAADAFIAKRPFGSDTYTPNPFPGVTMERQDGGKHMYRYVRKPNGAH